MAEAPAVSQVNQWIDDAVQSTPIVDLHTHLYPPNFGPLMLWGIDELVTYHYLIAETLRIATIPYEQYWAMTQKQQAELIWKTLFVEHAPISEACRGVLTVLQRLGLDVASANLNQFRDFFHSQTSEQYLDKVMKLANVRTLVMTNDPFESVEREIWLNNPRVDPRFKAVLRIDPLLVGWPRVADVLTDHGYKVSTDLGANTMKEIRRFLSDWLDRMKGIYIACSLPPSWRYPDDSPATKVINEAILPIARERNLPFATMIGVNKLVNPSLRLAGDSVAKADARSFERLCAQNPKNKFLVTMLSRENQHELAVASRKFRNMLLFGCWWFMNNPILINEITRMRMELLGTSFVPQHSDARILDQIIYKWDHSRAIIAQVLKDKFQDIASAGWAITRQQVQTTVSDYFAGNFERFLQWTPN
ncbi:MAG: glucuronate isomerase [Phycisphaerales bacterium]|jgi:hypothetical protein|nr:glucuronate isomerase [Phycisphaerales bacterium]